jgi:hypothetical protein
MILVVTINKNLALEYEAPLALEVMSTVSKQPGLISHLESAQQPSSNDVRDPIGVLGCSCKLTTAF